MTAATQHHLQALLEASREERNEAVEALLLSLEEGEEELDQQAWEQLWAAELERRIEANEPGIPGEQTFEELRATLRDRSKIG